MSNGIARSRELKLIQQAAGGDREACGALVKAHQASVYAYILRLSGRAHVAEDVVQEAFVRVLTNLDRFDSRFRFSTWLFTIARRVFLNHIEKRRPTSDSERMVELRGRSCGVAVNAADAEERDICRDAVQRALMQLTMEQREVLVLFHQHDWPIWLIAEQLRMPEGTVKSHLHRGRIRLRELLEDDSQVPGTPAWRDESRGRDQEAWAG